MASFGNPSSSEQVDPKVPKSASNPEDPHIPVALTASVNGSSGLAPSGLEPSGLEPELGGILRGAEQRTGFEPELGGILRQRGVYVDETTCIGCTHCAHVARNTFYIEPDYGRARVVRQDGDSEDLIQEAIDTCPVDCIAWVNYAELKELEEERKYQVVPIAGFPVDRALITAEVRRRLQANQKRRRQAQS